MDAITIRLAALLPGIQTASSDYPGLPGTEDFMNKIIPNFWAFLVQLLAFLVLVILFIVLGYKPVRKILKKRKDAVDQDIADARKGREEGERYVRESKLALEESRRTADETVQAAKARAKEVADATILQGEETVRTMKRKADEDIANSQEAAREEVRKEIVNVAIEASKGIIGREVDEADNARYVEGFIDDMEGNSGAK